MIVEKSGKPSVTNWEVVGFTNGRALVRFTPETGRTHQLRVHAASGIGVPILGDPVYGTRGVPMLLHAYSLSVPRENHPAVAATAALPQSFIDMGFSYG
jgi:tRNA pseudouridine32 synthase/23S rRNA pseudouridine746 synthase